MVEPQALAEKRRRHARGHARIAWEENKRASHELSNTNPLQRAVHVRMRNAWVAYHAGASWMLPASKKVDEGMQACFSFFEEVIASNARLRAEVERIGTLLFEASQDGEDIGPDTGSAWGAIEWAEHFKAKMREFAATRSAAFPDEDPENLAGPYGDGIDAMLGAFGRLHEERDEARAEVERLRRVVMQLQPHIPEGVLDEVSRVVASESWSPATDRHK